MRNLDGQLVCDLLAGLAQQHERIRFQVLQWGSKTVNDELPGRAQRWRRRLLTQRCTAGVKESEHGWR